MRVLTTLILGVFMASVTVAQGAPITTGSAANLTQIGVLGHGEANDLALTPNGKLLAVATSIGVLVTETRAPDAAQRLSGSEFYAVTVAVNPAGTRVAAGGWDFSLRVWDLAGGESLLDSRDHGAAVRAVAYSPDGLTLASFGEDMLVRLWDADNLSVRAAIGGVPAIINGLAFSPDSAILAGAGNDGVIRLWDVAGAAEIGTLTGHSSAVKSLAFQPDGSLVSGDEFGQIISWDMGSRTQSATINNGPPIWDMAASDGQLLTVGGDEILRGRALPDAAVTLERVNEPRYPLRAVAAASGVIATASAQEISIWDMENTAAVNRLWMPDKALSAAYSRDGSLLAVGTTDGVITIYEADTLALRTRANAGRGAPTALLFLSDGRLAVGWEDGTVGAVSPDNGAITAQWPVHQGVVSALGEPGEGNLVISTGFDAAIAFTNLQTGAGNERERNDGAALTSLAVDPVNRRLVVASDGSTLVSYAVVQRRVRNAQRGNLAEGVIPLALDISPDGNMLAVGSSDAAVRFLALPVLAEVDAVAPFFGPVTGVAYSPDGSWLAASSQDGYLRLIDTLTRETIFEQHGHTDWALGVKVNPAGTRVVTVGEDGVARVWAVAP